MSSFARNAAWTGGVAILLALISLSVSPAARTSADQVLLNAGFESGASSWTGPGFSVLDACARSGTSGAMLASGTPSKASQNVLRATPGTYTLRGYVKSNGGAMAAGDFALSLRSYGPSGTLRTVVGTELAVGTAWTAFTLMLTEPNASVQRVLVELSTTLNSLPAVCLDDLTLDGPAPATNTPTPTQTPAPTDTPSPTSTPLPTETPTATLGPESTPTTVVQSTATSAPATATPRPTQTAVPAPSFVFTNGGFEDGLEGWQKFGGELRTVGNPRSSGALAGALTSSTTSTKWAYQAVRVDSSLVYEFSADVMPGAGASEGLLRISWYASNDGSGAAIATDDSLTRAPGPSSDFVRLTTGPKTPPAAARSARLRVLLTPASAASATLYIDDAWFGTVTPSVAPPPASTVAPEDPPETPVVPSTIASPARTSSPTASSSPRASVSATPRASTTARPSVSPSVTKTPVSSSQAVSLQHGLTPVSTTAAAQSLRTEAIEDEGFVSTDLLAGCAVVFGLAGAGVYVWSRRHPGSAV